MTHATWRPLLLIVLWGVSGLIGCGRSTPPDFTPQKGFAPAGAPRNAAEFDELFPDEDAG